MVSIEQTCVKCRCKTSEKHHTVAGFMCQSCWDEWVDYYLKHGELANDGNRKTEDWQKQWVRVWNKFLSEKHWSVS